MSPINLEVKPTLVADQVFEALQGAIFSGELAAGTPLRVRDLAKMVGTSVMPVRDAIRRLEEAGLASSTPHKGAVVRTFTATELIQIYDVRTLLEVEAARRGTEHISEAEVEQMSEACQKLSDDVAAENWLGALHHDELMLMVLYSASRNPVLVTLIDNLWNQCRAYKVLGATEAMEKQDPSLWTPQPRLLAAVQARDVESVATITRESLTSARRRLEKRLIAQT
ncbi:GntR family transcriptional regulator [Paeniglutamicibacter sp. ABSL32-1]|uniref:GntR family transcriptional regulator n=1 Tax=Paeniglutamicibacter quisquiliarum TaxID=2849498 RepID=UPI001C2D8966|nr:GntR family transcriptional regulator [Paeniglutamicibacter quisquiliarum]MBV1777651.1 GntR family transcriptional regulator [Paeniglutamicibacter quisquiliarum]